MDPDDDIELLKQPHSGDREAQSFNDQHQAYVNPAFLLQSRSSVEDSSIDPASYHALQAAYNILKKNYNEKSRQVQELTQRHRFRNRNFGDNSIDQKGMEPVQGNSQSVETGAGASQDEETYNAEIRAKQGYIQHLERELLRSNSNLTKGNDEIQRLKKQLLESESRRLACEQERDQCQENINLLTGSLQQSKLEYYEKDERIQRLEEALESANLQNVKLVEEKTEMKKQLETTDRAAFDMKIKDDEIQDLKSKLKVSENEKNSLTNHNRDLEKRLVDKDREKSALEAKHKQYAIENEINRKTAQAQNQRGSESLDEIDGDREMLEKAFQMINQQQDIVQQLKNKVAQQKHLINELLISRGKVMDPIKEIEDKEERGAAQGASFHLPISDEKPRIYENLSPRMKTSQSAFPNIHQNQLDMPLARRSSDRGDYRGIGSGSQTVSPRINDSVKPTGNIHVPQMIAAEQPLVCAAENNVLDAHGMARIPSPRGQGNTTIQSNSHGIGRPNMEERNASPRTVWESSRNDRDISRLNRGEFNTSPRTIRQPSPVRQPCPASVYNEETSVPNIPTATNAGARLRLPTTNDINQPYPLHNNTLINASQIQNRMTQSEIIARDPSPRPIDNTTQQPVQHLDLTNIMSRSHDNIFEESGARDTTYLLPQPTRNQPNYENVYDVHEERNTESPENLYDHSVYVNDPNLMMSSRTPVELQAQQLSQSEEQVNNVSALKICPVCNNEFSRLTMDQFQTHVFECFDNTEEPPATIQPGINNAQLEEDRTCPMCGATYPMTVPQETYEQHVLAHFGEEPLIERFEMLH